MFRAIRRSERTLSPEKIEEILLNGEYGVVSATGENGYAYGVPKGHRFSDMLGF